MKKNLTALFLAALMLTGCAWMPDNLDGLPFLGTKEEAPAENPETVESDSLAPAEPSGSAEAAPESEQSSEADVSQPASEAQAEPAAPTADPEPTPVEPEAPAASDEPDTPASPAVPVEKPPFETEVPAPAMDPIPEESAPSDNKIHVTSLTLDKYDVKINVGLTDMPWVTMLPSNAENKAELWNSSDTNIAIVDQYGRITGVKEGSCTVTVVSQDNPDCKAEVSVTVIAKKEASEVTYINGILVANKTYGLPSTYNPGVDATAQAALDELIAGGAADGLEFFVRSGFRSYDTQLYLYNTYVGRDGKDEADRYSARPGHSEHQTGLAFDMNSLDAGFGETAEGLWLAEHCWEYGFVIRYAADKEAITGYMYEPWHIRYLGKELAKELQESGQCLEEYLGIVSQYME